jgi:uncharacterized protein involved in exopolysaccharide biosynthesis
MANIEIPEELGDRDQIVNQTGESEASTVDVLDAALVLVREWRWILIISLAAILAGGLISLLIRSSFTASAAILPPQQQQSAAALVGQFGSLSGLSGGSGNLFKNPGDLYVGMLASRTIADRLIETFNLKSLHKSATLEDARAKLKNQSKFEAAKDGLILITVTDHDPRLASDLANGYVDGLYRLNSSLATTEAAQRRGFFDQELKDEKSALEVAENDLKATEQKTGLIQLTGQSEMIIQSIAELRAEIASREVQIQSLKLVATDQNPETIRAQEEISSLRAQLANMENSQRNLTPGDVALPAGRVPEAAQEYARNLREVRYHEALYDLLSKQYEAARIDEAKSVPLIQVVDRAVPPEKKSGPHRVLIALGSGLFGFFAASVWVLIRHGFRRMRMVPENAARIEELRNVFRSRT